MSFIITFYIIVLSSFLTFVYSQDEMIQLTPVNRCLGNCAICANDDLTTCSGNEMEHCAKGYAGNGCMPKDIYAVCNISYFQTQFVLVDADNSSVSSNATWTNSKIASCSYINRKQQRIPVSVLGMFNNLDQTRTSIQLYPNFQNYIISFNLVRGSWSPITDSLRIVIQDEFGILIQDYIIEYQSKNIINPAQNLLRCGNNEAKLIQKFQLEGVLQDPKKNKLNIIFQGNVQGTDWGITNFKILFGCAKFLNYSASSRQCSKCVDGFFAVYDGNGVNGKVVNGCEVCPLNCEKCNDAMVCTSCAVGFKLVSGQCSNTQSQMLTYPVPTRTLKCPNNRLFLLSTTSTSIQRLQTQLSPINPHKKARLLFYIGYIAESITKSGKISIQVDGIMRHEIQGNQIRNSLSSTVKDTCLGFGDRAYYSYFKIVTPYFEHNSSKIGLVLLASGFGKFGVSEVSVQFQPVQPPKNDTPPTPTPPPNLPSNNATSPANNPVTPNNTLPTNPTPPSNTTPPTNPTSPTIPTTPVIPTAPIVPSTPSNSTPAGNNNQPQTTPSNSTPTTPANNNTSPANNSSNPVTPNANGADKSSLVDKDKLDPPTNSANQTNKPPNNVPTNSNTNSEPIPSAPNSNSTSPNTTTPSNATPTPSNPPTPTPATITPKSPLQLIAQKILQKKSQIKLSIRLDNSLILSILYPQSLELLPYIGIHLSNKNKTIYPQQTKNTQRYQQFPLELQESLLNQKISVFMLDQDPSKVVMRGRGLQGQGQGMKNMGEVGQILINRFDFLGVNEWDAIKRYSTFFQVLSWITIISTIVLSFLGNSVITQQYSLLLQIVFLHVYIFSEYLPVNFKNTISGLSRMQNLDYFTSQSSTEIQKLLLGNVIQYSPSSLLTFNKDINFSRQVYPCIIMVCCYLIWFLFLQVLRKIIEPGLVVSQQDQDRTRSQRLKLFIIRVGERIINFWYQVWQYMWIVFVWAALIQFHNMSYPLGADRSQVANMVFCFFMLALMIILPIATFIYLNKKYFRLDYFQYSYWYQNLFLLRLPEESLPSNHHRINIIVRNIRYGLYLICFAYLGAYPIQCLVVLIIIHIFSLLYLQLTRMELKPILSKLNILEHGLLVFLSVAMLIAYATSQTLTTNQYMIIGHVMTTLCLLLSILGAVRVAYYAYHKGYDQVMEKEISQFKPAIGTERVV